MRKKDVVFILVLILIAGALFGISFLNKTKGSEYEVIIEVDGSEYAHYALNDKRTVTISQPSGAINVVEIATDGVYMASASCNNQVCVHQGKVTMETYELDPFIICLPNKVVVQLKPVAGL